MMAECYCARMDGDTVTQVIVCESASWANSKLGGEWISTGTTLVGIEWVLCDGKIISPQTLPQ